MLTHSCGEMSACFTHITSITTCTRKFISHTGAKTLRDCIFYIKKILDFKSSRYKPYIKWSSKNRSMYVHNMISINLVPRAFPLKNGCPGDEVGYPYIGQKKVTSEFELEFFKQTVETLINFCFCFPSFLSRQRERLLSRTKEVSIKEKQF